MDVCTAVWRHCRCCNLGLHLSLRSEHFLPSQPLCADLFLEDVIKTRVQAQETPPVSVSEQTGLLQASTQRRLGAIEITKQAYQSEGIAVFFRGLGICSARAFIVNAVQWAVYEWMMLLLQEKMHT